jgi:hypothetical protein
MFVPFAISMGEERNVQKASVRKLEGKSPLGKLRHRWEDGFK